jgi:hypothetical protein
MKRIAKARPRLELPESENRRLRLYALAASTAGVSVLALAQPAAGEVVYTPVHQVIDRHQQFPIDLNHDGIVDFVINNYYQNVFSFGDAQLRVQFHRGAAVVVKNFATSSAAAMVASAPIAPHRQFRVDGDANMAAQFSFGSGALYSAGHRINVSNRYLGLRFEINGQTHYGWARLTTQCSPGFKIVAVLTGYAYESTPDAVIKAGDEGGAESRAETVPSAELQTGAPMLATLSALSLGAPGLVIWRREEAD